MSVLLMCRSFYINLPIGGVALALILLFYVSTNGRTVTTTRFEKLRQFDLPGLAVILSSLVCYFLAMEWGGVTKPWESPDVIGTLIGWIALSILFVIIEWSQGEQALVIFRIIKQRNVLACCAFSWW